MSGKNINFDDENMNKSSFYKNRKIFNIFNIDVNKILICKNEPYGEKVHLNTLLNKMIIIALDLYV